MSSQCDNIEMSVLRNSTPYQVLSQYEIATVIGSVIIKAMHYLKLTPDQCLTLLLKFKWDLDSLKETFDAFNDTQKFLLENHIVPRETVVMGFPECSICCFEGKLLSLACGHQACEDCWKQYLKQKVQDGEALLECMDSSCKLLIDVKFIVRYKELEASNRKLVIDSYVESSFDMTWCAKECGMAIKRLQLSDTAPVACSCGSVFCFSCERASHLPATCRQMQLWEKKCATMPPPGKSDSSDSTTQEWLVINTKGCPRCSTLIEKNGGCSHMKCPNKKCRFSFCWKCHESWSKHKFSCDKKKLSALQSRVNQEVNFKVFQLYFEKIEKQKKKLKQEGSLPESSKLLVECRQTLIHSYIFAFYLSRGDYFTKFEQIQKILEQRTNELSRVLDELSGNEESMRNVEQAGQNCQDTQSEYMWNFMVFHRLVTD
ncbi:hypothetical protein CAEBREN_02319 [Caenorhabditis brenneri]|uniref:RBR-type E3 ubiquitin transferase n=1 Tax=Caenorhabditis brenneri TaxID=135651 RepID=G0MMG5_CAEBE|nr:hypothetical protein CAEBREN_02319 [Caenorhabditis brenneri]